jgi:hypothetical protein
MRISWRSTEIELVFAHYRQEQGLYWNEILILDHVRHFWSPFMIISSLFYHKETPILLDSSYRGTNYRIFTEFPHLWYFHHGISNKENFATVISLIPFLLVMFRYQGTRSAFFWQFLSLEADKYHCDTISKSITPRPCRAEGLRGPFFICQCVDGSMGRSVPFCHLMLIPPRCVSSMSHPLIKTCLPCLPP